MCYFSHCFFVFEYILWPTETRLSIILLPASAFKGTRPLQGPLSRSLLKACLDPTQSKALIRNKQPVLRADAYGIYIPHLICSITKSLFYVLKSIFFGLSCRLRCRSGTLKYRGSYVFSCIKTLVYCIWNVMLSWKHIIYTYTESIQYSITSLSNYPSLVPIISCHKITFCNKYFFILLPYNSICQHYYWSHHRINCPYSASRRPCIHFSQSQRFVPGTLFLFFLFFLI